MDVTKETERQTSARLLSVLKKAEIGWLPGEYAFWETSDPDVAALNLQKALAIVRDEKKWSLLTGASHEAAERFVIFTCHFDSSIPNSGFVGWLASEIKRELGSGVFLVCGQNRDRGGIFDYWGVPSEVSQKARALVDTLRSRAEAGVEIAPPPQHDEPADISNS